MSSVGAIINIAVAAAVLCVALFALKRNPRMKIYYFLILGLAFEIAGSIMYLVSPNTPVGVGGETIGYYLATWVFIMGVAYLLYIWVKSVEWQLADWMARMTRRSVWTTYIIVTLCTVGLVVVTGVELANLISQNVYNSVIIALSWVIVGALGFQSGTVGWLYFKESKSVEKTKRYQLLRLVIFTWLMFAASLLNGLAFWFPSVQTASYFVMFLWLVVLFWPGSLTGFDRDVEVAGQPRQGDIELGPNKPVRQTPFNQ